MKPLAHLLRRIAQYLHPLEEESPRELMFGGLQTAEIGEIQSSWVEHGERAVPPCTIPQEDLGQYL